ncbi:MAG: hypothetical protein CSA22_05940 [Deltaproteobacteria bacterium]|nr:MAG: hypothetical protein CSA22_05940 [Deltaproteobacteria bacterium]
MTRPNAFSVRFPVKIHSGKAALDHLPVELAAMNTQKPLMLTTRDMREHGRMKPLIHAYKDSGQTIGIHSGIEPVLTVNLLKELAGLYRNHGYDAIVSVGGGAVMDAAKALNIVVSEGLEAFDEIMKGRRAPGHLKPLVHVATEQDTGFEAMGSLQAGADRVSFFHLMPQLAIIDPRMVKPGTPATLAMQAMTALGLSWNAFTAAGKNPLTDAYATLAARSVCESLKPAAQLSLCADHRVMLAGAQVMAASAASSISGTWLMPVAEAVSDFCARPLPDAVAVLMAPVAAVQTAAYQLDTAGMFRAMAGDDRYAATPSAQRPQAAFHLLQAYQNDWHLASGGCTPRILSDLGISESSLPELADAALSRISEMDVNHAMRIFESAFSGRLFQWEAPAAMDED